MWPRERWVRKHIAWLIIFIVFLVAAFLLAAIGTISQVMDRPPLDRSLLMIGLISCAATSLTSGVVFYALAIVPTRKHVARHCRRVCENCLFVLTFLPKRGKCPECGREYDIDETIGSWYKTFDGAEDW